MSKRPPVIGIDLGTTNSVSGVVQSGQVTIIPNRAGGRLTPSVVALSRDGKRLVGATARRQAITNPEGTIHAAKRLIGRRFSSPEVQATLPRLSYAVREGAHDDVRIRFGGVDCAVPELSALVLSSLREDAEAFLGQPVSQAVITVPAHFSDAQRQATKDAGRIAGLEVLRILNEPTAAAVAYAFGRRLSGRVLVFDLGGGTFDVSLLDVGDGVYEVLSTGGDTFLGGEDFDQRIIDWLAGSFANEHGIDLRGDPMALQRLRDAAERAKIELSTSQQAQVNLPFLYTPKGGGTALHLQATLTREQFESLTRDLAERTIEVVGEVLLDAGLRPTAVQEVLLVGGQTRMPMLQTMVHRHFGREPSKGVHPEEVVAVGAALHAHTLGSGEGDVTLLDVTSLSLGVAIAGGFVRRLIPRNTTVPTAITETFATSRDGQETVKIMVLQGEAEHAAKNELLGAFSLSALRPAPRGEVKIDVTFEIDSEGIVSVSALNQESGARQQITVAASGGLTPEELEALVGREKDLIAERGGHEARQRRTELLSAVVEAQQLLPRVRALTGRVSSGGGLGRAEAMLAAAAGLPEEAPLPQVVDSLDEVQRLIRSLRAMVHGPGDAP